MNLVQLHFGPKQPVLSPNVMSFLLTALLAGWTQKARHYQLVLITRAVVALLIKCFIGIQSQLHPIRFSSSQALNVSHILTHHGWIHDSCVELRLGFPPLHLPRKGKYNSLHSAGRSTTLSRQRFTMLMSLSQGC